MDTTHLGRAYRDLTAAASAIGEAALPAARRADVDWTLAHVALSDEMLATAAERLLAGEPVTVDNRTAMDETVIAGLIARTSHAERVALVRRNGAAFVGLVRRIPAETAEGPVDLHVFDRAGRQVADERMPWGRIVRMRAEEHLPGHAARLAAIRDAASATRP
ncbi:hypothetical protein [Actinoallomurus sp. NPDC052274]|uniref:hypothetical protein n=1 Tax=Actinoallomurus sp. NPDC052274 TaxID=3155420 RepID=UPI0034460101